MHTNTPSKKKQGGRRELVCHELFSHADQEQWQAILGTKRLLTSTPANPCPMCGGYQNTIFEDWREMTDTSIQDTYRHKRRALSPSCGSCTTRPNVYSSTGLLLGLCSITVIKWPREEGWYLGCHRLPRVTSVTTRARGQGDSPLRARGWGSRRFWRNPLTGVTGSHSLLFMTVLSINLWQVRARACMCAHAIA